jgi:hypothetical protein
MTEIYAIETATPPAERQTAASSAARDPSRGFHPQGRSCVRGSAPRATRPVLPALGPGEIWMIEHPSAESHLSSFAYRAMTAANVFIYDRTLHAIVAANLPLGGYAEPASAPDGSPDKMFDRCIRFARDGWSVVWFVDHGPLHPPRSERVGRLVNRLIDAGSPPSQSVRLFVNADKSITRQTETELGKLGIVIDATTSEHCLAIAFAAVGTGAARHLYAISSNGLAG